MNNKQCDLYPSSDDCTQDYLEAFHVVIFICYGTKPGLRFDN